MATEINFTVFAYISIALVAMFLFCIVVLSYRVIELNRQVKGIPHHLIIRAFRDSRINLQHVYVEGNELWVRRAYMPNETLRDVLQRI